MTDRSGANFSGATVERIAERFVPDEMRGQLTGPERIARYTWAAAFCSGKRVLDAGCGAAYGAELINAAGAAEVVAIDRSEAALELAKSAVTDGVTLEHGDVESLPFGDGSFDIIACFDLIEHVDEPDRALDEFARVLRPDGLLLLSSPNRDQCVPDNSRHRLKYTRSELQAALKARFPAARIISQHVMLASVISWSDAPVFEGAQTQRMIAPRAEDEIYLLAIAGTELPPDPGPVVTLGEFAEPRRWLDHINAQRRHIEELTNHVHELEGREGNRRTALERLAQAEAELVRLRMLRLELEEARHEVALAEARLPPVTTVKNRLLIEPLRRVKRRLVAEAVEIAAQAKRRS